MVFLLSVSHPVTIRVELGNVPGSLRLLTTGSGDARGNIFRVDLVERDLSQIVQDITVPGSD
jgi:hypothetical protein